jgi:hypothetical protein
MVSTHAKSRLSLAMVVCAMAMASVSGCNTHGRPRIVQKNNRHSSGCGPMVVAEHFAEALSALNRMMG